MSVRAVILAGQRPGVDPLCESAGVKWKADIAVAGTPMLSRVAEALEQSGLVENITISGYDGTGTDLPRVEGGCGPADSALMACRDGDFPVLLTTCDHALLTPEIVKTFLRQAQASKADMAIGLATEEVIVAAYPETVRTYMRFADHAISGCNLFYLATPKALDALDFWRSAQSLRKQPLALARKIGLGLGVKFASGRLKLDDAFVAVGKRLKLKAAPVLLPYAEAAIDVDSVADLAMVEKILAREK